MLSQSGYWAIYLIMSISEQENWSIKGKGGLQSQTLKRKRKKKSCRRVSCWELMKVAHKKLDSKLEAMRAVFTSVKPEQRNVLGAGGKWNTNSLLTGLWNWWRSSHWALSPAVHVESFFLKIISPHKARDNGCVIWSLGARQSNPQSWMPQKSLDHVSRKYTI